MNRKRIVRVGLVLVTIIVILFALHLGGGWLFDTFKEMHGL